MSALAVAAATCGIISANERKIHRTVPLRSVLTMGMLFGEPLRRQSLQSLTFSLQKYESECKTITDSKCETVYENKCETK